MRTIAILLSFAILATFLVKNADAVACTSLDPDVPDGCTNCADEANAENDDCTTTTTTTTTVAPATTRRPATRKPNKKIVRIKNLQYTNVRTVRVNKNNARNNQNVRRPAVNVRVLKV